MLGKHTLKPGEKTELKAVFNTKDAPGPFEKITTIQTDASGQEQIDLFMVGTVKEAPGPKITILPRRIDLGILKPGESKAQVISATNPGELPLKITGITTKKGSPVSVATGSLPLTVAAGQKTDVELTVLVGKSGPFNERIAIESNAKNAPKTGFVILVTGKVE